MNIQIREYQENYSNQLATMTAGFAIDALKLYYKLDTISPDLAYKLAKKDGGHNKFLEQIQTQFYLKAPRYFWQQFDTYRNGVSKQSESTMHTILKNELTKDDFVFIYYSILNELNDLREKKDFDKIKALLPEGYFQERAISVNYKCLRNIYKQRKKHKLQEWRDFCAWIESLPYSEFITE